MEETSDPTPSTTEKLPEPAQAQALPMQLWGVLVLIAFLLGLGAGYMIWAQPQKAQLASMQQKLAAAEASSTSVAKTTTAGQTAAAANPNAAAEEQQVRRYDVPVAGNPSLGSDTAQITIIEFSDYQCPFCLRWHQEVWPQIQATYGDKVRLVYRDFPLESIHPQAVPAAEAADCAGEQKKYWEYNNLLFGGGKELGPETYLAYAKQLGLDETSFKTCVDERRYQAEVQDDFNFASQLGVRSTPTFFVNGLAIVGAQPFQVFQQVIDMEIAGKIPK